tara:strand:- start:410 stop:1087 length:678 start_codon:yes stop_codon:yes gene_type:complete
MNKYLSIIPCRAGSKGLINKNILPINDKPLYMYTVEQAIHSTERCLISTDIMSILDKPFPPKVDIIKRKKSLSCDNTPLHFVLNDIFNNIDLKEYIVILLQVTSPLRTIEDINNAIEMYETKNYSMVMSVTENDSKILKYGLVEDNIYRPIYNTSSVFMNRQDLPKVYCPNGAIYIFSVKDYLTFKHYPISKIGAYSMPKSRSIDIDTKKDFDFISKIIIKNSNT